MPKDKAPTGKVSPHIVLTVDELLETADNAIFTAYEAEFKARSKNKTAKQRKTYREIAKANRALWFEIYREVSRRNQLYRKAGEPTIPRLVIKRPKFEE